MDKIKDQLDVIKISGKDAETFIQGQITNDITLVSGEKKSIYTGYCSPKGRLLAFFFIAKIETNYFLFCPPCISNSISKRLAMYILRSDVKITCSPKNVDYFLVDKNNLQKLPNSLISIPETKMQTTLNHDKSVSITMLDGIKSYFFIFGDKKETLRLFDKIYTTKPKTNPYSWNEIHIENIIPNIFHETQDLFIPQSLNLDLINAINFKKGCYTGQEVVARTHYLGKAKRRMYLGHVEQENRPKLGSNILVNDEKVGSLVNFYKQKHNVFKILVELRIEKVDANPNLNGYEIHSLTMQP
ncbi:MAG: folate-binding protein YgfZ [Nitrosomonadales bacterium]|nr:folate-binding protein YgfZ [Nitrosomonadales bacterium]MBT5150426.1 folate-binding protein YgfZ [Nitrosomonadales bacterium]MBT6817813.1 folate-binding protein YgfZ [Nitrosomonadales bacterium]MBT7121129.1 folate-binding protein YgfZ [Nitrosomonadales bacterium]MBT7406982.1 folate-binding protein YgfZ [Nitrosomonadales bacterium]